MKDGMSVMMREGFGFGVVSSEFTEVVVDIVRIAVLGFQLNGHVFDLRVIVIQF